MKSLGLLVLYAACAYGQVGGGPLSGGSGSGSGAPTTNPTGGANNYAPLASPTFTGTVTGNSYIVTNAGFGLQNWAIIDQGGYLILFKNGSGNGNGVLFSDTMPTNSLQIQSSGEADFIGKVVAGTIFHETLTTPASSTATCAAGDFADDANYHYVCTATNTWKRAALSAF